MTERSYVGQHLSDVARLFDGERLTLGRQLAGLRKNALADLINKTPTAIAAYEAGTKHPSPTTVGQLALVLGVEPHFFLPGSADTANWNGPPHFRSLRSTTQLARDQAEAYGKLVLDTALSVERHVEFPEVDVPVLPIANEPDEDGPERIAARVRNVWGITEGPVGHLVRAAENHGVLTVFAPPQTAAVDAYSIRAAERPIVLLNPIKDDYWRQRYDVAHEIGHLVMHSDSEPGSRIVEEQANRFAAEFLMPAVEIADLLPSRADWPRFSQLKQRWGVSIQALLFRARTLKKMPEVTYRNAMASLSSRGWRRREPGPRIALESPSLLPQAIELLRQVGIHELAVAEECRVPITVLRAITARMPLRLAPVTEQIEMPTMPGKMDVVPLMPGASITYIGQ